MAFLVFFVVIVGVALTVFDSAVGAVYGGLGFVALMAGGIGASVRNGWKWYLIVGGKPTEPLTLLEIRLVTVGIGMLASVFGTTLTQMAIGF